MKTSIATKIDSKGHSKRVSLGDLAISFGIPEQELDIEIRSSLQSLDLSYELTSPSNRDKIILQVLKFLEQDSQRVGVLERTQVWREGWQEHVDEFISTDGDLSSLVPRFLRPDQPIRFQGDYIIPQAHFERDFLTLFQLWFFKKYFSGVENIYEFGCGSSFNLAKIAVMFPLKRLYGLDFVQPAIDLVGLIAEKYDFKMEGVFFDLLFPNYDLEIKPNSGVLTFGTLEQLAGKFEPFINFLLEKKPQICCHVEPTIELYDDTDLFDHLAILFHRQRGYSTGLLGMLESLAACNKIRLHKVKRLHFGSLMMEGYTYMVWSSL